MALALGLAVVATVALGATPEEQAAFREEARRLTEQAHAQQQQADTQYELSQQIFISEYKKADGVDDQADAKLMVAFQRWLQGGAKDHAKASLLRESARSLLLAAYDSGVLAALLDERAQSERSRTLQLRENAEELLASSQDAETMAIVMELDRQADKNDRDAQGYEKQAARLGQQAERTTERAGALVEKAVQLETGEPID